MKSFAGAILIMAAMMVAPSTGAQLPRLPLVELTVADVVDALVEYDVVHEPVVAWNGVVYDGTWDSDDYTIRLGTANSIARRREVVIHELLHEIYWRKFNIDTGATAELEAAIDTMAHKQYLKLFGAVDEN